MTDLKDHAQKIERIVQALTAEGIGRDVAVSTALMRFPPPHESGHRLKDEISAIKTKDYCLVGESLHTYAQGPALDPAYLGPAARALDPIPELADCEPVHCTLMFVADRDPPDDLVSLTATQRGYGPGSWIYAGEIGKREAQTAVRFLRAQQQMRLVIGSITRYGTLHRFDVTTRGPRTYYVMEFKLADDRKLAVATVSVNEAGRPVVDYPAPQQPQHHEPGMLPCPPTYIVIAALDKAFYTLEFKSTATSPAGDKFSGEHHNWGLIEEFIELASAYKATKTLASLTAGVHTRFGYVTGHSVTKTGPDLWRWSLDFTYGEASDRQPQQPRLDADTRAALFVALGREESTLTTPQLVAALAGERDTLIDREAQMRAACIGAIGPVSSGSTLDLVHTLAEKLKRAQTEHEATKTDHAGLRENYKKRGDAMDKATKTIADALGLLQVGSRNYVDVAKLAAAEIERIKASYTVIADAQKQVRETLEAALGGEPGHFPIWQLATVAGAKLKRAQAEIENRKSSYEQSLAGLRAETSETADILRGIVSDPSSQAPLVELAQRVKAMASWTQGTWMQAIWKRVIGQVPAPGSDLGARRFKLIEVSPETSG